jgi:hypothetical protein
MVVTPANPSPGDVILVKFTIQTGDPDSVSLVLNRLEDQNAVVIVGPMNVGLGVSGQVTSMKLPFNTFPG